MSNSINIWQLIAAASGTAKLIMLVLIAMLVIALYIFGMKWWRYRALRKQLNQFKQEFWQCSDLQAFYEERTATTPHGIDAIFVEGFREFRQFKTSHLAQSDVIVMNCRRAMEAAITRETADQESLLSVLATFGSTAPYIGLLGTVWGILVSFIAIGSVHQTSIASVAPGIAESLIATACGLLAAIPSVLFYNFCTVKSDYFITEYEAFIEEFINLLQRQIVMAQSKKTNRL